MEIKEFRVEVWTVSDAGGKPPDLRQAARNVALALKESGGAADYQENLSPTKRYGRGGLLINGSFRRHGEQHLFRALLTGEGPKLWQVVVSHPASYRQASTASQRIIDSVRID